MDPDGKLEEKIVSFISSTPIGRRIRAAGFDIAMIVKIARGDEEVMIDFITHKGVPRSIA